MIKIASIYDVNQNLLIEKVAVELKKLPEMKPPLWSVFCKTGTFKERPPLDPDWWFMRSSSILRKVARMGPIGVAKLKTLYGGKKNRGMAPERFYKGSGSILRKALQQLEKAGFVKQDEKSKYKGRRITPKGKSLLDKAATAVQKETPKPVKPKAVVEEKKATPKIEEKKGKEPVKGEAKEKVVEKPKVEEKKPKSPEVEEKKPEEKKEPVKEKEKEEKPEAKENIVEEKPEKEEEPIKNE